MDSNRLGCGFTTFALFLVIGGLIGAGLGFLFAARTGRETRENIRGRARESLERLGDTVDTIWGEG